MKESDIAFSQILGLFVSHFHPDHAGAFELLRQHSVTPLVLEWQMPHIEWLNGFFLKPKNDPTGQYVPIDSETLTPIKPGEAREILNSCGIDGEVLHTPGHSEDGMSLIAGNAVFVGDLPRLEAVEAYGGEGAASWRKITNGRNLKDIYYAHGNTPDDNRPLRKLTMWSKHPINRTGDWNEIPRKYKENKI